MDSPNLSEIRNLYRKRAKRYNFTANLYYLIGFREWAYRRMAVNALQLRRGDTVVEIGCGTGLNISLLQEAVGPEGRIIGVDMTDAMLAQAQRKVKKNGWKNVELILDNASNFQFPQQVDGILSTFAITLIPEYDTVIQNGARNLTNGKRWSICDFKVASNGLSFLAPLLILLIRPFGGSWEAARRHPWESLKKHLSNVSVTDVYLGFAYIATGEA